MKRFFKYLFTGFKYLLIQGFIEIVVIVALEYLGIKVLSHFSKTNLFIENVQGVAWEISMKTIMFSFVYIPVFIGVCALLGWKKGVSSFVYGVTNALLMFLFSILFLFFLRHAVFSEVLNILIVTVFSSIIILVATKISAVSSR